ncbi:MAG: hypothetical protein KTR31_10275 [Myxococcales bacterium]|nr:hypothetical protein [Myxococcales bacterium]
MWRCRQAHFVLLSDLVSAQLRPVHLGGSTSVVADWLLENTEPRRVGTLGDALAHAWRNRLRWNVLEERALAERFADPPATALMLALEGRKARGRLEGS